MLEAEKAVICNNPQALEKYEDAIFFSNKNNFPHEEGLACERAAIFSIETNSTEMASKFLIRSYNSYKVWGAPAKLYHLRKLFGPYLTETSLSVPNNMVNTDMDLDKDSADTVSLLTTSTCKSFYSPRENKRSRTSEE